MRSFVKIGNLVQINENFLFDVNDNFPRRSFIVSKGLCLVIGVKLPDEYGNNQVILYNICSKKIGSRSDDKDNFFWIID